MINTSLLKDIAIGLLIVLIGYFIIKYSIPTPKPVVIPQDLIHQIDSLKARNAELERYAHSYDSTIQAYELKISILDSQIVGIQTKTTVFSDDFGKKKAKVQAYKPDEVDSFFKDRYKY